LLLTTEVKSRIASNPKNTLPTFFVFSHLVQCHSSTVSVRLLDPPQVCAFALARHLPQELREHPLKVQPVCMSAWAVGGRPAQPRPANYSRADWLAQRALARARPAVAASAAPMSGQPLFLGVDAGTSGVRACLVDGTRRKGEKKTESDLLAPSKRTTTHHPHPLPNRARSALSARVCARRAAGGLPASVRAYYTNARSSMRMPGGLPVCAHPPPRPDTQRPRPKPPYLSHHHTT